MTAIAFRMSRWMSEAITSFCSRSMGSATVTIGMRSPVHCAMIKRASGEKIKMANKYDYGGHGDLTPPELFCLIVIDVACDELGIDDAVGIAMILLGQRFVPTRGKFHGAVKGTSVASRVSRRLLPYEIKHKILPTVTSFKSLVLLKVKFTRELGVFVGRAVPVAGWIITAADVSIIMYRSAVTYNRLVKPEDRF